MHTVVQKIVFCNASLYNLIIGAQQCNQDVIYSRNFNFND